MKTAEDLGTIVCLDKVGGHNYVPVYTATSKASTIIHAMICTKCGLHISNPKVERGTPQEKP